MSKFDTDVHLRLTRYLSNGSSASEAAELEAQLAANPELQHELDTLRRLWETSAGLPPSNRVDQMWHDIARAIDIQASRPPRTSGASSPATPMLTLTPMPRGRWARWRRWVTGLAVAASALLVIGYSVRGGIGSPRAEAVREYRTVRGQRGVIQLGDGTRIELGVASVLRLYPIVKHRQEVELAEGEAVFTVTHDPARAFLVRSRNVVTEDLGTRFGVRAYHDDPAVRVVVTEGKVALHAAEGPADTTAVLLPGDVGVIMPSGQVDVHRDPMAEASLGWTTGHLHFENVPLSEVVADLERWYDVTIAMETADLATRRVTLSMPMGSLTDALDAITAPTGLTYLQHDTAAVLLRAK